MNSLAKLRYLGPSQTVRKYLLKTERCLNQRVRKPPALPPQDSTIDLHLTLLGHEFDLRAPNRWHRSPDTGESWPLVYSQAMAVTGPEAVGDVKLVWELNRHQFLPPLVARDPELTRRILQDWIDQNPYEFGVNWNSAMEVGLRLVAWLETFERAPQLRAEFAEALARHARFVRHNLSSDWIPRSNHLIGEAAALSFHDRQIHHWLIQAAAEQFFESGVNREQSVAYHRFATHLLDLGGLPQPKALAYLSAIRQPDGSLPMVGDNDDGCASSQPLELPPASATSVAFSDAGHYVIRNGGDYCFIRCGEFGLPPTFPHAHADLMSPVLWLRGEPVFVDTGTFTYNGDPAMRRYFRSAQAHNVVTIDGREMAEPTGTFSWRNPPRGVCEKWSETEFIGSVGPWRRRIGYDAGTFARSPTTIGRQPPLAVSSASESQSLALRGRRVCCSASSELTAPRQAERRAKVGSRRRTACGCRLTCARFRWTQRCLSRQNSSSNEARPDHFLFFPARQQHGQPPHAAVRATSAGVWVGAGRVDGPVGGLGGNRPAVGPTGARRGAGGADRQCGLDGTVAETAATPTRFAGQVNRRPTAPSRLGFDDLPESVGHGSRQILPVDPTGGAGGAAVGGRKTDRGHLLNFRSVERSLGRATTGAAHRATLGGGVSRFVAGQPVLRAGTSDPAAPRGSRLGWSDAS